MIRRYGKVVFLSALIFLFLTGTLVSAMQEENKEKKKEPAKNNETSTSGAQTAGIVRKEVGLSVLVKPVKGNLLTNDEINIETPTIEVAYINGKPNGKAILRYKNGTRIEGEYNNGLKIGLWITYDNKGRKFKQESYKDGKEDGKFITWDESGYVYETDYKDGLFHGKQSSWDKNGKLIYEHGYKDGKAHGRYVSWYPNGAKSDEGYFNEGTGKRITWYPSGKIAFEVEFKNGKKYGKEVSWYENGRKKQEQTYNEEGKNIGKFYHWYEDGKVAFKMEYDQNGQRIYKRDYDRDGNLTFDNDRPVDKKKTTNSFVEIPPIYDLRNVDGVKKVTSVKNQLKTDWSNTCWAFGYIGALESHLMCVSPQPSPEPDYSEQHLADKNHGWDTNGLSVGGSLEMALAYFTRGGGPIDETDMPYDPAHSLGKQISLPPKKWIREVQRGVNWLYWTSGNDEFCKEHIFTQNHGCLMSTIISL